MLAVHEAGRLAQQKTNNRKTPMKTTPEHVTRWRIAHHAALVSLHADPSTADGLKMWRALRRLESLAHRTAEGYCNGTTSDDEVQETWAKVKTGLARVFGGAIPAGISYNLDPRGYALKLANPPEGMHTDWGRDGILAATID
jgi:hypothetical protein